VSCADAAAAGWAAAELGADPAPPVTVLVADAAALVTVLVTLPVTVLVTLPTAEDTDDTGAVRLEVTTGSGDGWSSVVAACACREKSNRRKRIPAAAIANWVARRATRRATGCGIDSSHWLGNRTAHSRRRVPGKPRISRARSLRTKRPVRSPPYIIPGRGTRAAAAPAPRRARTPAGSPQRITAVFSSGVVALA
jgi:hypothetical protein